MEIPLLLKKQNFYSTKNPALLNENIGWENVKSQTLRLCSFVSLRET